MWVRFIFLCFFVNFIRCDILFSASNRIVYILWIILFVFSEWAYQWKMSFNPDISKQAQEVIFSRKAVKAFLYPRHWNTGLVSSGASLTSWREGASLALVGSPSSVGVTIKMPYGVDVSHWPALHPIFSYWVG